MAELLIIMNKGFRRRSINKLSDSLKASGGRVHLYYPPRVIIGRGGKDLAKRITQKRLRGVRAVYVADRNTSLLDPTKLKRSSASLKLGKNGLLAVRSWLVRNSKSYRKTKRSLRSRGHHSHDYTQAANIASLGGYPPMTGLAAMSVIVVYGPQDSDPQIAATELEKFTTEVQSGTDRLTQLAQQSGADLIFGLPEVRKVTLDIELKDIKEEVDWRDPAMEQLGFGKGMQGVTTCLDELKQRYRADWGCILFLTSYWKYERNKDSQNPAYSYPEEGYCIFRYLTPSEPSGYVPDELDKMVAHEIGHICGGNHNTDNICRMDNSCLMNTQSGYIDWDVCRSTASEFQW